MLALYNNVILVLQMEPVGALTAINLLLASNRRFHTMPSYSARISNDLSFNSLILFNHKMRMKICFEFWLPLIADHFNSFSYLRKCHENYLSEFVNPSNKSFDKCKELMITSSDFYLFSPWNGITIS